MSRHQNPEALARDRLVSFTGALKIIGISRSTAYRLIADKTLPQPIKLGALTFFSERELQTWIADRLASRGAGGSDAS
ncbi:AlpA family phage regulatory protein [Sinirhodobacter sp. WL0062]|uniref:AlpA family phage regulatory protein n=1 Tax=Rhodobacter flavimaris TaxID=2907145 RepID=A0ABS8YV35_9RHOB|nr:AlpA family phage regulatory protein [Sinirhodobacter sp. WL0062]MCE5972606.1 AlpA family phage regulatory protein [Sinirhodobacter sp. WL0062]